MGGRHTHLHLVRVMDSHLYPHDRNLVAPEMSCTLTTTYFRHYYTIHLPPYSYEYL